MFMVLYSLLLAIGLIASAPWWLWRMATSGRYREGLRQRLGFVPHTVRAAVTGKKVVWVHAVSVGEVLAAERLISELKAALGDGWVVAVSTTTATGQKIARERLVGSPVFFYPLDFAFAVRAWLRVLRPSLFVLVESEFWPRMLVECEKAGVPVAVVNARVSDRSFPRYLRLRRLWKPLLGTVTLFLAQGEESAERLRLIGAPAERVRVSGNLKYDGPVAKANAMTERLRPLLKNRKVIVAGSTMADEEHSILKSFYYVREAEPTVLKSDLNTVLILAPRHPQRFAEVAALIENFARTGSFVPPAIHASELTATQSEIEAGTVILLDTLGDLASVYELGDVAFVGGSLSENGGHNPLEPARFGVPVMMGPYFQNFREIVEQMIAADAICIVSFADYLLLAAQFTDLMRDGQEMGSRGKSFFDARNGATKRTVEALVGLVGGGV